MEDLLATQKSWLNAQITSLEGLKTLLPIPEQRNWVGDASALYGLNLMKLHADTSAAIELLRFAKASTTLALNSLGDRG